MLKSRFAWPAALTGLGVLSAILYLAGVAGGARSEYYASIAMSMSKSFSNFFYGAIDPAGTITLDKIPGSYWLPAIFVKLFGFSTWAIETPNGLAAIGTVIVVAISVRHLAGGKAGIIAGVLVASTPIIAAVARANQPEMPFVFTLAMILYSAVRTFETGHRRHLIYVGLWIAAAFNMYMIEAWAIWPAFVLAWFFVKTPLHDDGTTKARLVTWGKLKLRMDKIIDIAIAFPISLAASLIWIIIVGLVPDENRPFIGSTMSNSPWEMVFGYNALGRFVDADGSHFGGKVIATSFRIFVPPFSGDPSLVRLFNYQVAPEISWLIIGAVISAVLLLWFLKEHKAITIFLTTWSVTFSGMFSVVGGMHQFYTASLAIPMASLIALATVTAIKQGKAWMILLIAVPTIAWGIRLTLVYQYLRWTPIVELVAVILLGIAIWRKLPKATLAVLTMVSIGFSPAAWAVDAMFHSNPINPVAGPSRLILVRTIKVHPKLPVGIAPQAKVHVKPKIIIAPKPGLADMDKTHPFGRGPSGVSYGQQNHALVVKYLKANRGGAKYLLTTFGAQAAASYITETGENILPIGGFSGNDPAPTPDQFKKLVRAGDIKYVLMDTKTHAGPNGASPASAGGQIAQWVYAYCNLDGSAPGTLALYVCNKNY